MPRRIVAIIQARMNARRLPGKVLFGLEGKTVLERVVERVKECSLIQEVMVATSIKKEDLKIVTLCSKRGIRVYCGSEADVLDRYFQAARLSGAEDIVRITADCPMIDPMIIEDLIKLHLKEGSDYSTNTIKETFPDGQDVEIFKFSALKKAWKNSRMPSEREHVTPYMKKHPGLFKISSLGFDDNLSSKRWTLDERADYRFIKLVYKDLYKKKKFFGMKEIMGLLSRHPEYELINNHIRRNEGYLRSLKKDKVLNGKIAAVI